MRKFCSYLEPEKKPGKTKGESKGKKRQKLDGPNELENIDNPQIGDDDDTVKYLRETERRHANNARER